jgi:hypothetical protein
MLWVRISIRARCTTIFDKVYQWLAAGRWFSPGPPFSSIKQNWPPRYNRNIVESGDKHHQTNIYICVCVLYLFFWRATNSGAAQGVAHSRYGYWLTPDFSAVRARVAQSFFFFFFCVVFHWSFYLVRLRITVSDYPFGILKLFFYKTVLYADMTSSLLLFL